MFGVNISPHPQTPPLRTLFVLCMWGGVTDVITRAKFHLNRFTSFGSRGIEIHHFPQAWRMALATVLRTNVLHCDHTNYSGKTADIDRRLPVAQIGRKIWGQYQLGQPPLETPPLRFSTIPAPGSPQLHRILSFTFHFRHMIFIVDDVKLGELSNNSFEGKIDILGGKNIL